MMKPKVFAECLELISVEGRAIISFHYIRDTMREKIMSRCGITVLAEVDEMTPTSGNLLYSSMTTRRYSPDGKGPARSTATSIHGSEGRVVMESGSR